MPGIIIEPDDVCLSVTEACNSNCIMCPMSSDSRRRGTTMPVADWQNLPGIIPKDTKHITITGGEPFLEHKQLLTALDQINRCFPNADVLILTNGRILSIPELFQEFKPLLTERYCIAIPIHGSEATLHDKITQSKGSFDQSMKAIRMLSSTPVTIEVRIVGHRNNLANLSETFKMLVHSGARIDVINLIAMEMTGCAARNRNQLWVDYRTICDESKEGILYAILHGINIGLYNFPLCTVPEPMWSLVKDSITPSKVRFYDACQTCREYQACGGLFYSTYELGLCHVMPFAKG